MSARVMSFLTTGCGGVGVLGASVTACTGTAGWTATEATDTGRTGAGRGTNGAETVGTDLAGIAAGICRKTPVSAGFRLLGFVAFQQTFEQPRASQANRRADSYGWHCGN